MVTDDIRLAVISGLSISSDIAKGYKVNVDNLTDEQLEAMLDALKQARDAAAQALDEQIAQIGRELAWRACAHNRIVAMLRDGACIVVKKHDRWRGFWVDGEEAGDNDDDETPLAREIEEAMWLPCVRQVWLSKFYSQAGDVYKLIVAERDALPLAYEAYLEAV